jgi:hypothetical protein
MIHTSSNYIISKSTNNTWEKVLKSHCVHANIYFNKHQEEIKMPIRFNEFIPITIETTTEKFHRVNGRKMSLTDTIPQPINVTTSGTLQEYIKTNNNVLRTLLQMVKVHDEEKLRYIPSRGITICSDGGAKDGKGSFGIVFVMDETLVMECFNRVPSTYDEINCHRSEAVGVMVTLKLLELTYQYIYNPKEIRHPHKITILCDNESVVKTVTKILGKN